MRVRWSGRREGLNSHSRHSRVTGSAPSSAATVRLPALRTPRLPVAVGAARHALPGSDPPRPKSRGAGALPFGAPGALAPARQRRRLAAPRARLAGCPLGVAAPLGGRIEHRPTGPLGRRVKGGTAPGDQAPGVGDAGEPAAFDCGSGPHGISAPSACRGERRRGAAGRARPPWSRQGAAPVRLSRRRTRRRHARRQRRRP